jgi:hypothetical protein
MDRRIRRKWNNKNNKVIVVAVVTLVRYHMPER